MDYALFTALWWPEASLERLQTLAYFIMWLFIWDDEVDEPTGAYSEDLSGAQTYREQTLRFLEDCMGLATAHPREDGRSRSYNHLIQSFDVIGSGLCACYDTSQLRRFYNEMARFIKDTETEQRGRLCGKVPTVEEYWRFRLGSDSMYAVSALGEYSMATHLPPEVMDNGAMRALWDETNIIVSITNDLLSLRKEISRGCIDSLVPLTFASTNDLEEAISLSVAALQASKERFDEAAKNLLVGRAETGELYQQLQAFIEVQRSNCVGNITWR